MKLLLISAMLTLTACGSAQTVPGADNPLRREMDAEARVFDPSRFAFTSDVPAVTVDEAEMHLFNEKGFLFAHRRIDEVDERRCQIEAKEPQRVDEQTWQFSVEMDELDCHLDLEPEEHRLIAIDVQVRCEADIDLAVSPLDVVVASSFDSDFRPCGEGQSYHFRTVRSLRTVKLGEQSETGHSQTSMIMSDDGGFCHVSLQSGEVSISECGEYTKLTEMVKINGEGKVVKTLAVRHLITEGLQAEQKQLFHHSGTLEFKLNNWFGQILYKDVAAEFHMSDGQQLKSGSLTNRLFDKPIEENVFR